MAFFVVQGVAFNVVRRALPADEDQLFGIALSYSIAGVIVTLVTGFGLRARKVPQLGAVLGLTGSHWGVVRNIGTGCGLGILSGGLALGYLFVAQSLPWFSDHAPGLQGYEEAVAGYRWVWFAVLAVVIAPPCEEFLFRSLIHRGVRRSYGFTVSAICSAGVFALVHSPASFIPVFTLGLFCAWGFERSGSILTSITTHVCHNGIAVGVAAMGLL